MTGCNLRYEAINLVGKASETIDEPEWYGVLSEVYMGLDAMSVPLQLTQTWFYLHYAELTGYELNLERDVTGQLLDESKTYMYDAHEKGLRPSEQGDLSAAHIKFRRLMSTKSIGTVAQVGGVETILPDCWLITRQHAAV